MLEEELDGIDIDETGNLEDSPRLMFIDEECGNLLVVNDSGELSGNTTQKKKSDVQMKTYRCPLSDKCCGESISSVTMWNIYCELVK